MIKFGVLSWLPSRVGSFFLRKTSADIELRHVLVCASMPQRGGAYCEARLELYRNMTEQLLMRDRVSSVAARNRLLPFALEDLVQVCESLRAVGEAQFILD
jgi:hypothetical protein